MKIQVNGAWREVSSGVLAGALEDLGYGASVVSTAVNGEFVLTPTVTGDTTDVVAYAATHSGGTALVLFNRNENTSETVSISLSAQTTASTVTVETYNKALYDETDATTPVWAAPTTTSLGAQSLPLTLTLTPWSMNVVIIH